MRRSFHSCSDPDMPTIITEVLKDMVVINGTDMSSNRGETAFSCTGVICNNEEGLRQYGHSITAAQWCDHHRKVRAQLKGAEAREVFEPRTATGSELFSSQTCPPTTTFILLNIFSLVKTIKT